MSVTIPAQICIVFIFLMKPMDLFLKQISCRLVFADIPEEISEGTLVGIFGRIFSEISAVLLEILEEFL